MVYNYIYIYVHLNTCFTYSVSNQFEAIDRKFKIGHAIRKHLTGSLDEDLASSYGRKSPLFHTFYM